MNILKNVLLKYSYFFSLIIKYIIIIEINDRNKSGIKGPVWSEMGIRHNKIEQKFINLNFNCTNVISLPFLN